MIIASELHRYEVGKQVADASTYRVYLCTQKGTPDREFLLQIASVAAHNGALDRAAFVLRELTLRAETLEAEYEKVRSDPNAVLNYNLQFLELVESLISREQGERRVNILAFRNVKRASQMVPLRNITHRDRQRVDLRTSAWILGKLLKLLTFTHPEGFAVNRWGGSNVLIEPDEHYVVVFDCSATQIYPPGEVPVDVRRQEIAKAAQTVVVVLGGNLTTGTIPDDGDDGYARYTDYLLRLARGSESNASKAHEQFYELIDQLWPRGYHPFTTYPLS